MELNVQLRQVIYSCLSYFSCHILNMKVLTVLLLICSSISAQNRVSADAEIVRVNKGLAITVRKEIFFNANGRMVVRYLHPEEYYMVTNTFGEARIYRPKANEVMVINDSFLSSESELIYYFLTNKIEDLGLRDLGFSLSSTRSEGNKIVRTFTPSDNNSNFSKIEMVHENHLPVYCAYFDTKSRIVQKIYYSDYQMLSFTVFPKRITEITYIAANDSIVSRKLYSNIKVGRDAISQYFDFSIPSDAKIVDSNLLLRP